MENIQKITLTGGPCGGKTQSSPFVLEGAQEEGFDTFFLKETATETLEEGLIPGVNISLEEFQERIFDRQLEKEEKILKEARRVENDRVTIVCDRDLGDGLVYQEEDAIATLLRKKGLTKEQVVNRSKYIIHFITIAKDRPEVFDTTGRLEKAEEACKLDDKILNLYPNTLNKIVLYNTGGLEEKQVDAKLATKTLLRTEMKRIIIRKEDPRALDRLTIIKTTDENGQERFIVKEDNKTYILGIYQDGSFMRTLDIMKNTPIPKWVLEYEEVQTEIPRRLIRTNR